MKRALWLWLFQCVPLSAGVIYTYHGYNFDVITGTDPVLTTSDHITMSFSVPNLLVPPLANPMNPEGMFGYYDLSYDNPQCLGCSPAFNYLGEPLTNWTITDGVTTFSPPTDYLYMDLGVDLSGNIWGWYISATNDYDPYWISINVDYIEFPEDCAGSSVCADESTYWGNGTAPYPSPWIPPTTLVGNSTPGYWTVTSDTPAPSDVPEPGTGILLLAGAVIVVIVKFSRVRRAVLLLACARLLSAGTLYYTYHGSPFTDITGTSPSLTTSDAVTITFGVPAPLPDGVNLTYQTWTGGPVQDNTLGERLTYWDAFDGRTGISSTGSICTGVCTDVFRPEPGHMYMYLSVRSGNIYSWAIVIDNTCNGPGPLCVLMITQSSDFNGGTPDFSESRYAYNATYWPMLTDATSKGGDYWTVASDAPPSDSPEPSTWALTLLGIVTVAKFRRMRRLTVLFRNDGMVVKPPHPA